MPVTSRPATGVPDEAPPVPSPFPPTPAADPVPSPTADSAPVGSLPLVGDAVGERHRLSRTGDRLLAVALAAEPAAGPAAARRPGHRDPLGDAWIRWSAFIVLAAAGSSGWCSCRRSGTGSSGTPSRRPRSTSSTASSSSSAASIPMHRVQSLRTERGPMADHYRMTNLRINTAAGSLSVQRPGPRRGRRTVRPDQPAGRRGRRRLSRRPGRSRPARWGWPFPDTRLHPIYLVIETAKTLRSGDPVPGRDHPGRARRGG